MKAKERLLKVEDLKVHFFTYGGIVEALDGVSFDLFRGEVLGLVGESGCGKSVTALSIMRLVPRPGRIISGRIIFDGEDLLKKSEKEMYKIRGSRISLIFQDPTSSLNPLFTVGYQVAEPLIYHHHMRLKRAWDKAVQILTKTRIPDPPAKARSYPHELSGGMRQRSMIAMALACRPDLLIADEPTTNLDVTVERQILELVKDLQREFGTSVLWITHNLGVIAELCDRVVVMYAGNVVEIADVEEIFFHPLHPYTQKLLKAIPSAQTVGGKLEEIPGTVPKLINPPSGCRFHPRCPAATDTCREEKPPMIEVRAGHFVACHLYGSGG
ncbi:ABC transporter ATP-binding protein [Candidatus Acetothermia bacterium]|nr:MAG: ABC transporter ATP-binding protein [Candidatus Acetothermia bacterium]